MADKKPRSSFEWLRDSHGPTPDDHPGFSVSIDDLPSDIEETDARVVVREVVLGDPADEEAMPDGSVVTLGVPLREVRKVIGGADKGFFPHPVTGAPLPVSLETWKDRDPDTTLIQLAVETRVRKSPRS